MSPKASQWLLQCKMLITRYKISRDTRDKYNFNMRIHTLKRARTHRHTHRQRETHTHTRACTRTHTHTHTHRAEVSTPPPSHLPPPSIGVKRKILQILLTEKFIKKKTPSFERKEGRSRLMSCWRLFQTGGPRYATIRWPVDFVSTEGG